MSVVTRGRLRLVEVRALGPVWLLLVIVVVASFSGWSCLFRAVRSRPAVAVAGSRGGRVVHGRAAIWWVTSAGAIEPAKAAVESGGCRREWGGRVLRMGHFQMVAAFPFRNQPAPLGVYLLSSASSWGCSPWPCVGHEDSAAWFSWQRPR